MKEVFMGFYGFSQEVAYITSTCSLLAKSQASGQRSVEFRFTLLRGRLVYIVYLHVQEVEEISFGAIDFSRGCMRNVFEAQNGEGCPLLIGERITHWVRASPVEYRGSPPKWSVLESK